MTSLSQVFSALRRKNRRQEMLLFGCLMFSTLLMTAYCMMMYSPTVQNTLPEGGDSRKQVMMIFVLAIIGCGAFVLYASGLFLRQKSHDVGILLALGAPRTTLMHQLRRNLLVLASCACAAGMALGTPLSWLIWSLFRLTLADTPEMVLIFDFRAYGIPLVFTGFVLAALSVMLSRFLGRIHVLDIITESHHAEPVHAVPRWFGLLGILLIVTGALLGYFTPAFCVRVLHWYPPEGLTAVSYLPALAGLYLLLLHTVVNGWHRGRSRYTHLVSTSMMQFQGQQTVRNMLVVTVLTAGALFSAFYVPMMVTPAQLGIQNRPADYSFFYRADQNLPDQSEIEQLAQQHGVTVTDFVSQPTASLAIDGFEEVETKRAVGITYIDEYRECLSECRFLSEHAWNTLTGDSLDLAPGTVTAVYDSEGGSVGMIPNEVTRVTNPVTGKSLSVLPVEPVLRHDLLSGCRVMDDSDYAALTAGLPAAWRETQVFFQAEHDSYPFAKALFSEIVSRSGPETALCDGYDRIQRARTIASGEKYFFDPENSELFGVSVIRFDQSDSSAFRLNWLYMPQFRTLDQADFLTTMAVFLLLFAFVSILCLSAVAVILFSRSMTLVMINAWVYDDLRKLGASNQYLRTTLRGQIARVFRAPILTGTLLVLGFDLLILLGNGDGGITFYEWMGLVSCLAVAAAVLLLLYGLYRLTLRSARLFLGIR